jgi:hypothetical protein
MLTVHGFFEISNFKHQKSNKFQILNDNNLSDFDYSNIDKDVFFNSLFFFRSTRFGILNSGHWDLLGIWDLLFGIIILPCNASL